MTPEERLARAGFTLPPAPAPVGAYVPFVRTGNLVFTSGQLPMRDGKLVAEGRVGAEVTVEQAAEAARVAVLNALAQVAAAAGGLVNVVRIVRLGAFVASAPDFTAQPKVANAASDLLVQAFGDAGRHARTALGTNVLPLNATIEIELVVQIR